MKRVYYTTHTRKRFGERMGHLKIEIENEFKNSKINNSFLNNTSLVLYFFEKYKKQPTFYTSKNTVFVVYNQTCVTIYDRKHCSINHLAKR